MPTSQRENFYRIITEAVKDIIEHGYDIPARIEYWVDRIRDAAEALLIPLPHAREVLNQHLLAIFKAQVERGAILRRHTGVARFTLDKVKPQLHAELTRTVLASADLIKLNRKRAIETTLQRFAGWASSVPAGGTKAVSRKAVNEGVRKSLASLPFEERRVAIDQGHKFVSGLSRIIATDGGAIAAIWHSNWRQRNYNYRVDHKERDEQIYIVRNNWAIENGLMKKSGHLYTDQITQPGEKVYCRCYYQYLYTLQDLPEDMLTLKGQETITQAVRRLT